MQHIIKKNMYKILQKIISYANIKTILYMWEE